MPVTGYLGSKAGGFKANWFGLYELPDLFGKAESLNFWTEWVHTIVFYAMAAVIGVHVAAALYHHAIRKDGVLKRMLP